MSKTGRLVRTLLAVAEELAETDEPDPSFSANFFHIATSSATVWIFSEVLRTS